MPNSFATIPRKGIIFRPGDYGDKGIYTDADIHGMASETPVPIRMSHGNTLIEKAGRMGEVKRMWADFDTNGKTVLMGEWDEPEPLAQLLEGVDRSVSAEVFKDGKKVKAVALEVNPHVGDAAFFSAAIDDAFAFAERGEQVHSIIAFTGEPSTMNTNSTETAAPVAEPPKGRFAQFMAWLGGEGEETDAAQFTAPVTPNVHAPVAPATPAISPEIQKQLDELATFKANETANFARSINEKAEAAYEALLNEGKAIPADKDTLVAAFTVAHQFDAKKTELAYFSADDAGTKDFSMGKFLSDELAKRPVTNLDKEQTSAIGTGALAVFDQEKSTVTGKQGEKKPLATQILETAAKQNAAGSK